MKGYGQRPSAFQANRFKRQVNVTCNEEMADELFGVLEDHRASVEVNGGRVSPALFNLERTLEVLLERQPGDNFDAVEFEGTTPPSKIRAA